MCLAISSNTPFIQNNSYTYDNKCIVEIKFRWTQDNFKAFLRQFHDDFYEKNNNNSNFSFIESARQKYFPILNLNDIDNVIGRIRYVTSYISYDNNNVCENHKISFDNKEYILTFALQN